MKDVVKHGGPALIGGRRRRRRGVKVDLAFDTHTAWLNTLGKMDQLQM